jgi:hypothetical protein
MVAAFDGTSVVLGGSMSRLLFILLTVTVPLVFGAAHAQTGYYDAYGNPIGYPNGWYGQYGAMPGYGYGMDMMGGYTMPGYTMPGYGMPVYGTPAYGMPGFSGVDPIQQQMAALEQQIDTWVIEQMRPFIDYYRTSSGDYQTPDAQAMELGRNLWCTNFPVECQRAMNTTSPEAAAWMAQSAADHEQRMAQNQQAFDTWWQGAQVQWSSQQAWHEAWLKGVIQGE